MKAVRTPSRALPDVQIVGEEAVVQRHPDYAAAKAGDYRAAARLAKAFLTPAAIGQIREAVADRDVRVLGVAAQEQGGINEIPQAMAYAVGLRLNMPLAAEPVQVNRVGHTRSSGWHRLANQAIFDGAVVAGTAYWIVDDFVGQGGTLANLAGYIQAAGGRVVGITTLAGRRDSARLAISEAALSALREKHGRLEAWWTERFGFGFDALTESEGRYLLRAEDADTIRNRLAEAAQPGRP